MLLRGASSESVTKWKRELSTNFLSDLVQDALGAMRSNRTTIIVAHRLSTIMDANVIIVMKVWASHHAILTK